MAGDPTPEVPGEPLLLAGPGLRVRRAHAGDLDALARLAADQEVCPFIGSIDAATDRAELLAELARSAEDPRAHGRFVIDLPSSAGSPELTGGLAFEEANARSRIAQIARVMVDPGSRGRGVATAAVGALSRHLIERLDYHRVQLECYDFNHRAVRMFERAGFVREGVRRLAYRRHGAWNDAILLGLVAEDLDGP